MEGRDGGWMKGANRGRAEIDTRPPFRSVKEAVSLFGERIFTTDLHTPKNAQKSNGSNSERMITEQSELQVTKHNLEKAQQETKSMANQMCNLKEELENTKRELQELKDLQESKTRLTKMMADLQDMEDLKYDVNNSPQQIARGDNNDDDDDEGEIEFQKKRYVTSFAYPTPSMVINVTPGAQGRAVLERHPSVKKNKKKKNPFTLPLIGGIFPIRRTKCDPY